MDNTPRKVPIDLLRLRSATKAYLNVLEASTPALIALNEAVKATGVEDQWMATLLDCAKTSLLDVETPGTVASIAEALSHLLGEQREER